MLLSLRDAATVLGCSPRTLRARLARGEIAGRKVGGRWQVEKGDLPLTRAQRRAVQEKVADLRDAVEAAVPASLKARIGAGRLEDVDVFTETRSVLRDMAAAEGNGLDAAQASLREALDAIAEGHIQFDREVKLEAFTRARASIARAVACLLIDGDAEAPDDGAWAARIEAEILPRLAGLIRWAEALPTRTGRHAETRR